MAIGFVKKTVAKMLAATTSRFLCRMTAGEKGLRFSREEFRWMRFSFSQFGEDRVVMQRLQRLDPASGIYVDVGACDPIYLSNTLLLHKHGWRGVNIDLSESAIRTFNKHRPNDVNVVAAVSDRRVQMKKLTFKDSTVNCIVPLADANETRLGHAPIAVEEVTTRTLTDILSECPFHSRSIHYLNVDCERHDVNVLLGLDFNRYAPKLISVEAHTERERERILAILRPHGYAFSDLTNITAFFMKEADLNSVTAVGGATTGHE